MRLESPGTLGRPLQAAAPVRGHRIDFSGHAVGLSPPPYRIHAKFLREQDAWRVPIVTSPGRPPAIARWLERYEPEAIRIGPGLSPRWLEARFTTLPGLWASTVAQTGARLLELTPAGTASLFLHGDRADIDAIVRAISALEPAVRVRDVEIGPHPARLTRRQHEIVSLAVAMGYYEVPHRLNLRALADRLGLSLGAAAEALRRGEAAIVCGFVDETTQDEWAEIDGTT